MIGGVVGKRYAKALLSLAQNDDQVLEFEQGLRDFVEVYTEASDFNSILLDPKLSREKKTAIVEAVTQQLEISGMLNNFFRLLVAKNRINDVEGIFSVYEAMANDRLGKARAEVVVAQDLSEENQEILRKELSAYTGKEITLDVKVDTSILGGAVTRFGSLVLDGSVKNRLNQIRETILKG